MSFCEHCGSKVENGVLCNCPDAQANYAATPPPPPRMATPPPPPRMATPPPARTAAPPPPTRTAAPPPPARAATPPPPARTVAPPPPARAATPPPPARAATPPPIRTAAPPPPSQPQTPVMPTKPLVPVCPNCNIQAPKGSSNFCGTCGSAYQMMEPPRPILKICTGCGKEGPKNSGQFCGECGGAYQMMEAPSFENGGVCPNCSFQVPPGSGDFCTHCGRAFYGGGAFKMPDNINLGAAGDILGGIGGKLGMSLQRLILGAASLIGILSCLIPWYRISGSGVTMTANAFRIQGGSFRGDDSIFNIMGFLVPVIFAVLLLICFLGDRSGPLGKIKFAYVIGGVICLILAILNFSVFGGGDYKMMSDMMGGGVSFGLYLMILMSLTVAAIPFVKQLER